ncbi:Rad52/Rad22 family DNA repair protein [Bacillus weihaiensis]|uniref:Rad52/Rad22 family DNA repair protein n=1 Tax=Bacillus weihaiensis TaxID=1547283 RepID=UPI002357C050|nr:Rad52/Rad22 family DNA repair protein [Bacillus weihaiensis]
MTEKILERLQAPFPSEDIEWRVQRAMETSKGPKAIVLAYVTNRAIMTRLDEVFGVGGWKNEYKEWRDKGVLCGISVKIDGEWVTKWDGAEETQVEATKGGFSGSMKRAAVQLGIGRYLYNLTESWVDIKSSGQNYIKTKVNGKEVKGYWDTPKLPSWALPPIKSVPSITSQQIGELKTKALEFAQLRGKTDKDVYKVMNIQDITKLTEPEFKEHMHNLNVWITKAKKEDTENEQQGA